MAKPVIANAGESSGPEGGMDNGPTALRDLMNAVLDVLTTMDYDAEMNCPWCGRNPHWNQCTILPIVQYASAVANAPPTVNGYMRTEVRVFAELMESVLRKNDWKSGWKDMHPVDILRRLTEECDELRDALRKVIADPHDPVLRSRLQSEAADVANDAMFLSHISTLAEAKRWHPSYESR